MRNGNKNYETVKYNKKGESELSITVIKNSTLPPRHFCKVFLAEF